MKSIGQKLILISFILALLAAVAVYSYLQTLKKEEIDENIITIKVAVETLPPGTLITENMILEIQVSDDSVLVDYIQDSAEIIGKYTKETILKNEGFHAEKLINKGEEDLSLRIDEDHRAVSINVTGDSGVSDLIKPGDFVDIIVYLDEKKDGDKIIRPELSKIILQNIRLLAIDKELKREEGVTNEEIPARFLVTLSVSIKELEKIVLAENTGILKLALRPLGSVTIDETKGTTSEELIVELGESIKDSSNEKGNSGDRNNNSMETFTTYRIKKGDNLRKISQEFYKDPMKYLLIKKANNIKDENLIVTGEIIKIPEDN